MSKKIQSLLIKHLMEVGHIELTLPDGIKLEIGVVQEDETGKVINCIEDYCYVTATRDETGFLLDSYNTVLQYSEEQSKILIEDSTYDRQGQPIRRLEVI